MVMASEYERTQSRHVKPYQVFHPCMVTAMTTILLCTQVPAAVQRMDLSELLPKRVSAYKQVAVVTARYGTEIKMEMASAIRQLRAQGARDPQDTSTITMTAMIAMPKYKK